MTTYLDHPTAPSAEKLAQAVAAVEQLSDEIDAKGGAPTQDDIRRLDVAVAAAKSLADAVRREDRADANRFLASLGGGIDPRGHKTGYDQWSGMTAIGIQGTGIGEKEAWATEAADRLTKSVGQFGIKALTTGGIDVPQMVESQPVKMPVAPTRVLDLLINRQQLTGNTFEYLRQTVRNNLAAPVADGAVKPTSVYSFEAVEDRARVFAHLSQPIPLRFLADHDEVRRVLADEMAEDLLGIIEEDALVGDGTGEHFLGLANVVGVRAQPFSVSVLQTLRKARTLLTVAGETPTAWVLNWADLEAIDLLREDGATGGFLAEIDAKVFGSLPVVGTSQIPAGVAYLGDWKRTKLYVRDGGKLDADFSGTLFDTNQVKLRYEGRFGFAVQRPAAFVEIDLTDLIF